MRPLASVALALASVGMAFALAACPKGTPPSADAGVAAPSVASPPKEIAVDGGPGISRAEGQALVVNACQSCHADDLLAQQRLTHAQWTKVVEKMAKWGANVDPAEVPALTAYLAATYGPDAGPFEPPTLAAVAASEELAKLPDPGAAGDATRGRALFTERCAPCHGPEARGLVGVNLVERPVLYRFADFAGTVRKGRGRMAPIPLEDGQIADLLAHLRALRSPAP